MPRRLFLVVRWIFVKAVKIGRCVVAPLACGLGVAGCFLTDLALDGFVQEPNAGPAPPTATEASTSEAATTPSRDGGGNDSGPDAGTASAIRREGHRSVENTTAVNAVTILTPEGTQSGDLLVACLALNGVETAPPSGWTVIAAVTSINNPRVFGYFHVAGAGEPASYTWPLTAAAASSGGIVRYTGVDTAAPVGTATQASSASQTTATLPSVAPDVANAIVVGCVAPNSSNAGLAITPPSGFTEVWNLLGKRQVLADSASPLAGPTGDKVWTFSETRESAGWLAFLRPAKR